MSSTENNQIPPVLHDFFPQKKYTHAVGGVFGLWMIILGIDVILFIYVPSSSWLELLGLIVLFLLNVAAPLALFLIVYLSKVLTLWDDYDYSQVTKEDLEFTATDGLKLFAYRYIPKTINLEASPSPHPTIIGLHGWNAHHREMDRYCLPSVIEEGYLYFTYDARGQGQSLGNVNDIPLFEADARKFISLIKFLPYVDKSRIAVVGMSMGANTTALAAYDDPDIKVIVMLSGPYDIQLTRQKMGFWPRLGYHLSRMKLDYSPEEYVSVSGINHFRPEGIVLTEQTEYTPNNERVFIAADRDDPYVTFECAQKAIEKLQLTPKNYRIFKKGGNAFEGNEWSLSVAIYKFISEHL